jgi:hypothetical protein
MAMLVTAAIGKSYREDVHFIGTNSMGHNPSKKLTVAQLFKTFLTFNGSCTFISSQDAAAVSYPEPEISIPHLHTGFLFEIHFNIILSSMYKPSKVFTTLAFVSQLE